MRQALVGAICVLIALGLALTRSSSLWLILLPFTGVALGLLLAVYVLMPSRDRAALGTPEAMSSRGRVLLMVTIGISTFVVSGLSAAGPDMSWGVTAQVAAVFGVALLIVAGTDRDWRTRPN